MLSKRKKRLSIFLKLIISPMFADKFDYSPIVYVYSLFFWKKKKKQTKTRQEDASCTSLLVSHGVCAGLRNSR